FIAQSTSRTSFEESLSAYCIDLAGMVFDVYEHPRASCSRPSVETAIVLKEPCCRLAPGVPNIDVVCSVLQKVHVPRHIVVATMARVKRKTKVEVARSVRLELTTSASAGLRSIH